MDLREGVTRVCVRVRVRVCVSVCVRAASLSAHTKQRKLQGCLSQGEFISLTSSPASAPLQEIIDHPSHPSYLLSLLLLASSANFCLNIHAVGPLFLFIQNL